jgi:hypothetical protein
MAFKHESLRGNLPLIIGNGSTSVETLSSTLLAIGYQTRFRALVFQTWVCAWETAYAVTRRLKLSHICEDKMC